MKYYSVKRKKEFKLEVDILGSKSITNRALILASGSKRRVVLKNVLISDDTLHMMKGLSELGVKIELDENKKEIVVEAKEDLEYGNKKIYVGNSGTTIRFLTSYLLTRIGKATLYGNDRMSERPIKSLVEPLKMIGAKINYLKNEGYPPIEIESSELTTNKIKISGALSSQYITSLLLSAPNFKEGLEIEIVGKTISQPYIDMSLKMMKQFNIKYELIENRIVIPNQTFGVDEYTIEGDCSSASYFLAMALITNSEIKLNNFIKDSMQGDYKFLDLLKKMGLQVINEDKNSITVKGVLSYDGIEIDLNDMPDMAQTLAVVALFANTPTKVFNVESMRIKETDRITALKNEITKIGGRFREWNDGFEIIPIPEERYRGDFLETYDDHRMAMALSLIGLRVEDIKILDYQCVSKTFPNYFNLFSKIY